MRHQTVSVTGQRLLQLLMSASVGLLGACGTTDTNPPSPPPPPPPATGIGPAGGTVAGPNGAQVVVPAGALSANTTIAVTESSAGSPVLPAGVTSFGAVFAFTPHGTTFAVPVMITVPFTASSVPAGTTPALYKTNAAGAWERMPTATVNGTTLTAAVAGFSWAVAAGAVPPVIATQPTPQSVTEPGAATFNARATNAPGQSGTLTYQWEKSDDAVTFGPILGATDSTYTTRPTTVAADNGDFYRVLVSNGATATSNAVKLTVAPPPPPPPGPGTWQAVGGPVTIGPAGTTSRDLFAAVALDLAGNPVVAWKGRLVGPGTSTNFINVKQWNGSSWVQLGGNLMLANRNGDTYSTPSIDVDPASGQPVVAWAEESSRIGIGSLIGAFDVVVKRWNGGAWVQLGGALNADPTAGAVYPKLRIAPGGAPMVTWWETPNYIAAKHWDGLAWASFGQQSIVWRATGSQDLGLTALTLDGSNPVVLAGASGGPVASRPTPFPGTGWTPFPSLRTDNPAASGWGAAIDAQGRLTVGYSTYTGTTDLVRVRRFDNGAWTDLGGTLFTDGSSTFVSVTATAVPYNTSNPIVSWRAISQSSHLQTFVRWDGTAWHSVAPPLPHTCELAVPTNASNGAAAPAVACTRSAGTGDIVVYRVVP